MLTAVTGFALWTLALAAYSIRTLVKGRYRVARVDAMGGTPLLGAWPMEFGYWCMNGFARALVALRVGPNAITLASLGTAFAAAFALAFGYFGAGGWLVIAAGLLDVLDGWVARARGVDGEAGEFFDSVVDRYCDLAIYGGLGAYYVRHWPALGVVVWLAMVASFMVTYARVQGEAQGVRGVPNRLMRRHERTAYVGVGLAASPIVASFVEPGVAHPVYHVALVACGIVALVGNLAAIRVASKIHRRLRHDAPGGRP